MSSNASLVFSTAFFPPPRLLPPGPEGLLLLEAQEHYSKGSCRNRCYIAGPQGAQLLSVPLAQGKNQQCPIREVQIDNSEAWQRQHWKSLRAAYGKSPFFIHYADSLQPLFQQRYRFLFDLNEALAQTLYRLLGLVELPYQYTEVYQHQLPDNCLDAREHRGKPPLLLDIHYAQVFEDRTGFLPDLSVLDLLFCTGPEAATLLRAAWRNVLIKTNSYEN